jgi:hypothetical protein
MVVSAAQGNAVGLRFSVGHCRRICPLSGQSDDQPLNSSTTMADGSVDAGIEGQLPRRSIIGATIDRSGLRRYRVGAINPMRYRCSSPSCASRGCTRQPLPEARASSIKCRDGYGIDEQPAMDPARQPCRRRKPVIVTLSQIPAAKNGSA